MKLTAAVINIQDEAKTLIRISVLCAMCLFIPRSAIGQATLIKDLNRLESAFDIEYDALTQAEKRIFFTNLGKELWSTDGTGQNRSC